MSRLIEWLRHWGPAKTCKRCRTFPQPGNYEFHRERIEYQWRRDRLR